MENLDKKIVTFGVNNRRYGFYLLFSAVLAVSIYLFYVLFNPAIDIEYEKKIKEENEAVKVEFNKEIIYEIKSFSLETASEPEKVTRSPFIPY